MSQEETLNVIFHNIEKKLRNKESMNNSELEYGFIERLIIDQVRQLILDKLELDILTRLLSLIELYKVEVAKLPVGERDRKTMKEMSLKTLNSLITKLKEVIKSKEDAIDKEEQKEVNKKNRVFEIIKFAVPTLISIAALFLSIFL